MVVLGKKEIWVEGIELHGNFKPRPSFACLTGSDLCKLLILQEERFPGCGLFALELHFAA